MRNRRGRPGRGPGRPTILRRRPCSRQARPGRLGVSRLTGGAELLGEYKDSGYCQPPSLVRRPDGQVIQMSALLYKVTSRIDGARDAEAIAGLVSTDLGQILTADQARYLSTAKLVPLGIVASQGGPAAPAVASPLLALRARGTLLPERAVIACPRVRGARLFIIILYLGRHCGICLGSVCCHGPQPGVPGTA